jgi:hypothetical protein
MLDYEARRRPELADLVAKIDLLDEDAIRAAPVKLPWMREALLMLKREHQRDLLAATLDQWVVNGYNADPLGEMRRWESGNTFVRVGRTQLEISCGQLIWLQNGVWIDTIWSAAIDPLLISETTKCGTVRRSDYLMAVRNRARQLCPETMTPEPVERIRFFRPPIDHR